MEVTLNIAQYVYRMLRAAGTYEELLGQRDAAKRIVNATYQRVQKKFVRGLSLHETKALLQFLRMKTSYSVNDRNHPEAIEMAELAFNLYTISPKNYKVEDASAAIIVQALMSYDAMGKRERWCEICKTLIKENDFKNFSGALLKLAYVLLAKNESSEEEIRQALLNFRAAVDRECAENPSKASSIHELTQGFSKLLSEPLASIIQPESNEQNVQLPMDWSPRDVMRLIEAVDAHNKGDFVTAMSLYDRYLQSAYAKKNRHSNILALKGLARSTFMAGLTSKIAGKKDESRALLERSLERYLGLVNTHEKDREYYDGITKETTNKSIRGHAEGFFRQARKMPRRRSIATSNGI